MWDGDGAEVLVCELGGVRWGKEAGGGVPLIGIAVDRIGGDGLALHDGEGGLVHSVLVNRAQKSLGPVRGGSHRKIFGELSAMP